MDTEITIDQLRTIRLMVCTPMYGGMCAGNYTNMSIALGQWASLHGVHVEFKFIFNESIVSRARCDLVDMFLESDCTHMVFIDADISLDHLDLMRMVYLTEPGTIVGAPCSKKAIDYQRLEQAVKKGVPTDHLQESAATFNFNLPQGVTSVGLTQLNRVGHIGTGVMCIHRQALYSFRNNTPDLTYVDGTKQKHLFFDVAIHNGALVGEDVLFCRRANEMNIPVYMAPWIRTHHWGSMQFTANVPVALQSGNN